MARVALIALSLAACVAEPLEPGTFLSYDITSDATFDRLHIRLTSAPRTDVAPLTPAMLAEGVTRPARFETRDTLVGDSEWFVLEYAKQFRYESAGEPLDVGGIAVLAYYGEELVGAAVESVELVHEGNRHWAAQGQLVLRPATMELWGATRNDENHQYWPCIRLPGAITHYLVREIDNDCDVILDRDDCQPAAYCPPDDPSAPTCSC